MSRDWKEESKKWTAHAKAWTVDDFDNVADGNTDVIRSLVEELAKAKDMAIEEGIQANTVVIDETHALSLGFYADLEYVPPMILGMELKVGKLPNNIAYVIQEQTMTERGKIYADGFDAGAGEQTDKILNRLWSVHLQGGDIVNEIKEIADENYIDLQNTVDNK